MNRGLRNIGLVVGATSIVAGPLVGSAAAEYESLDVVDMGWLQPPPPATEDSSRFVVNDSQIIGSLINGASEVIGHVRKPLPDNPDNIDGYYCATYSDANCIERELWTRNHLPPCSGNDSIQCVESVTFTVDGRDYPAEFDRYLDFSGPLRTSEIGVRPDGPEVLEMHSVVDIPAEDARGLPAGVNVGLWRVPGLIEGADRYVAVDLGLTLNVSPQGRVRVAQFGAGVTPVLAETQKSQFAPSLVFVKDPNGHFGVGGSGMDGWYEDCAYKDVDSCYRRTQFPEGVRVTLVGRITSAVSGWLHGRIVDPEISIDRVSGSVDRLTVSGLPTQTPAIQRNIANRVLPPEWSMPREPWFTGDGVWNPGTVLSATDNYQFTWFKGILPWLGDRADAELPTWSFRAVEESGALDRCLKSSSELVGLVTTSAMMYDGGPPEFRDGRLQYQVAGLHLGSDGGVAKGNYSLVMRSDAARCLYGFSNAPISADISVYSENGDEQVATTSVSERSGWLRLSAENFTFSSPTISVNLSQSVSYPVKITCVKKNKKTKGPKRVVVTGTKQQPPMCPKGYRPK